MIGKITTGVCVPGEIVVASMRERNAITREFFSREAERLAGLSAAMAERFQQGGRLLAFGVRHSMSDAQHIAVEFVHPVLMGKRALPALDLSAVFHHALPALVRPADIVVGFVPPDGNLRVDAALRLAREKGALTVALPGSVGEYAFAPASADPFVQQELIEIAYHTLWETVHVFLEREPVGHGGGAAAFLYPFLDPSGPAGGDELHLEVAASIRAKAECVERLRDEVARTRLDEIASAVLAVRERVANGATVFCLGNGGSATDANDLAYDLVASPKGQPTISALSLANEPATLTALANDVGAENMFLRQLIAHAGPQDVVVAFSTSGGSPNVIDALVEARERGLLTIALLGYDGGEILRRRRADHTIVVDSDQIPRVQEVQASIYHTMLDLLDIISGRP